MADAASPARSWLARVLPPAERAAALRLSCWSLTKLCNCTSNRVLGPFAPALGRLVGQSTQLITQLVGYNKVIFTLTALTAPAITARVGNERLMCSALGVMGVAMLLVGLVPQGALFGMFIAASLLQGLKGVFDAALQSLVGESVPVDRRGTYTGLVELAWGGSSLIGIPIAGVLLAVRPQSMFISLGIVQLIPAVGLRFLAPLPQYSALLEEDQMDPVQKQPLLSWMNVLSKPRVRQIALGIMIVVAFVDSTCICFGVWLQEGRGLSTASVAAATVALGVADFGGELLATAIIDRLGIARCVRASLAVCSIAAALLAVVGDFSGTSGLAAGMVCHFFLFVAAEVSVVSLLADSATVLPQAGGRVEALTIAGIGCGHIIGAFVSLPLYLATRGVVAYACFASGGAATVVAASWMAERRAATLMTASESRNDLAAAPAEN